MDKRVDLGAGVTYTNPGRIERITKVQEHLLASLGVLDRGFETAELLGRRLPSSMVVFVGLATHCFQRLVFFRKRAFSTFESV